jgi:hypothetical protein
MTSFERSRICREIQLNSPGNFGLARMGKEIRILSSAIRRMISLTEKCIYLLFLGANPSDSRIEEL